MSLKWRFYTEIRLCVLTKTRTRAHTAEQKDSSSLIFKSNSLLLLSLLPPSPVHPPLPSSPASCYSSSSSSSSRLRLNFSSRPFYTSVCFGLDTWSNTAMALLRLIRGPFLCLLLQVCLLSCSGEFQSFKKKKKKIQKQIKNILNSQFKRLLAF